MRKNAWFPGALALAALAAPSTALANGFEFPSNGPEQFARGSAWLARASDPLAVYFNPAALSRNGTAAQVSANISVQKTCFDRRAAGSGNDNFVQVGTTAPQLYGRSCSDASPFINPQLAFSYRLTDKLDVGFAVLGPSAIGRAKYPDTTTNTSLGAATRGQPIEGPAASRYIVSEQDSRTLWPQLAFGYEVLPQLRLGASLIWGVADISFGNVSMGLNSNQSRTADGRLIETGDQDLKARVKAFDAFVPGFAASAMYTIGDSIDVAAWFRWSDSIKAKGEAEITAFVYDSKLKPYPNPQITPTPTGKTDVEVPQPWDLRIGGRYYKTRQVLTEKGGLLKDPLRDEVFDVALDVQYSRDSAFDTLGIYFRASPPTVVNDPASGAALGSIPADASVPHKWRDAVGVRLGGDYNVLPEQLAVRAGAFFQTSSIDPKYMNIDFVAAQRIGLTVGATYRLGPVDIQGGYGHIFFKTIDNGGEGELKGRTGDVTSTPPNRSTFPINGGKISAVANVFTVGVVPRF